MRRAAGAPRPMRRPGFLAGPAHRGRAGHRRDKRRGTAGRDTGLQRAGDGRPGARRARQASRRPHPGHRRSARAELAGRPGPAHPAADLPFSRRARGADHAPRPAAGPAPAAAGPRARRDPPRRPAVHRAGDPRAPGRLRSESILLDLEDANAFVVSLDPERTWFRYHHLFADLLRLELRRTLPGEIPALHRQAAGWLARHGHVVEAIRHTQAAGDWHDAARLLADQSFSLTLDGQAQTIQALVRAFPPGAGADPELALVRAGGDLVQGRLDEAAAHVAVAGTYPETAPPDRQRRLRVALAALKLSLARRRGHLAGVLEQVTFLNAPVTGQSDEDIALGSDLRAVALMNLGIIEAWSLALPDAERHLQEGAILARESGRPYLEVSCLAQLGFASKIHSFAVTQGRCREAIAAAERHGWATEPVIAPALLTLAASMIYTGDLDEGERWLQHAARALEADTG